MIGRRSGKSPRYFNKHMKVLQVHTTVNMGSIGHIVTDLDERLAAYGHQGYIAHARGSANNKAKSIQVGSPIVTGMQVAHTRITDRHGFAFPGSTREFLKKVEAIDPDLIQLHNLHGYYLHVGELFRYLRETGKPVVWTLHDCWAFTGHCTHFESAGCMKWETGCYECPKTRYYPASRWLDNSERNYAQKKRLFTAIERMHIVTPSRWLREKVARSFLSEKPVSVIHNGIDLKLFDPSRGTSSLRFSLPRGKKIILAVAFRLDGNKGLNDLIELSGHMSEDHVIVLVGMNWKEARKLPPGMNGVPRIRDRRDLARLYAMATVFVNPTWQDNFPTTNLEALASGTPVVTYDTGGSPESLDKATGRVVPRGDTRAMWDAILELGKLNRDEVSRACRKRAEKLYNKEDRYLDYIRLYEEMTGDHPGTIQHHTKKKH